MIEPLSNVCALLSDVLVFPSLIKVVQGTAYAPMANVGHTHATLFPHSSVGMLISVQAASLPMGVTEHVSEETLHGSDMLAQI